MNNFAYVGKTKPKQTQTNPTCSERSRTIYGEQAQRVEPILPATPFGGQTRFDERLPRHAEGEMGSEASPILSGISLFFLFALVVSEIEPFTFSFFLSPTPNYFPNNYLRKTDLIDSAQFKQWRQPSLTGFDAPFSAISRVIRELFELIQAQFKLIGAIAWPKKSLTYRFYFDILLSSIWG